jgi:hypothetical protein
MQFILFLIVSGKADPTPNGGKPCTYNEECNAGGTCTLMPVNGTLQKVCQCDPQHGNVDCSYLRVSKNLAGGLQITLMWVGIFGLKTGACGACEDKFYVTPASITGAAIICLISLVAFAGFIWNAANGIQILLPPGQITDVNGYYPG